MRYTASAALVVWLGTGVYAHHSHADFLDDRVVTVEGRVESLKYENPHSRMTLLTADGVLFTIEWQAGQQLRMASTQCYARIYSDTLNIGDRLVVAGFPPRDPVRHELVNLQQVTRPADGWHWWLDDPRCRH